MKLLFNNTPWKDKNPWIYGRWEPNPDGTWAWYLCGQLDATKADLLEVFLKEEGREVTGT